MNLPVNRPPLQAIWRLYQPANRTFLAVGDDSIGPAAKLRYNNWFCLVYDRARRPARTGTNASPRHSLGLYVRKRRLGRRGVLHRYGGPLSQPQASFACDSTHGESGGGRTLGYGVWPPST
ncbi:hypothetical protein SBA4_2120004 [Candidatus Sulfopaludibacter sp. SbA4]|nr:hypothetical protein SBA4_2120004 [Candidatus Sulfopaludibacter sp. SbA4]